MPVPISCTLDLLVKNLCAINGRSAEHTNILINMNILACYNHINDTQAREVFDVLYNNESCIEYELLYKEACNNKAWHQQWNRFATCCGSLSLGEGDLIYDGIYNRLKTPFDSDSIHEINIQCCIVLILILFQLKESKFPKQLYAQLTEQEKSEYIALLKAVNIQPPEVIELSDLDENLLRNSAKHYEEALFNILFKTQVKEGCLENGHYKKSIDRIYAYMSIVTAYRCSCVENGIYNPDLNQIINTTTKQNLSKALDVRKSMSNRLKSDEIILMLENIMDNLKTDWSKSDEFSYFSSPLELIDYWFSETLHNDHHFYITGFRSAIEEQSLYAIFSGYGDSTNEWFIESCDDALDKTKLRQSMFMFCIEVIALISSISKARIPNKNGEIFSTFCTSLDSQDNYCMELNGLKYRYLIKFFSELLSQQVIVLNNSLQTAQEK